VWLDHFEKSSILRAALQAADALLAKAAAKPIKADVRIMKRRFSERLQKENVQR
jgi:hypothetical protein